MVLWGLIWCLAPLIRFAHAIHDGWDHDMASIKGVLLVGPQKHILNAVAECAV